ncbi:MAG TPA: glycerate kinase [Chthoniobacterales bacterium]|jgi:glycerate kinase
MRILVAPDKFKGSLGAREAAECIAAGLRHPLPNATIDIVPVADGGEGTATVISEARGGEWIMCDAHDPFARPIQARYAWLREEPMAVMEMSEAAGVRASASSQRDLLRANTLGVGEMLLDAMKRGASEIILGLGGSVTHDGGFGLARALGFRFLNRDAVELTGPVSDLLSLEHISRPPHLVLPRIVGAADVRNPLLGERGARTFGPQKGATPEQLLLLENALARLADVVARDLGCDFREKAGAGAAGGLGFGLLSFCGARLQPGFDLVTEILDLEAAVGRADIVITGEGKLDRQTREGKAPGGVAGLARKLGKRVFALVGFAEDDATTGSLFDDVLVLAKPPITREESMARTAELLRERARELGELLARL